MPTLSIENGNEIELLVGEKEELEVCVEGSSLPIYFSSSNEVVATVSSLGIVTARKEGVAEITASSGDAWDTILVRVRSLPEPSVTILTETPIEMRIEETRLLEYRVENASMEVSISSSDESVVRIQGHGSHDVELLATGAGTAQVLFSKENSILESVEVHVLADPVESLSISFSDEEIVKGYFSNVNINVNPEEYFEEVELKILKGADFASLEGNTLYASEAGEVQVQAFCHGISSSIESLWIRDFSFRMESEELFVGQRMTISLMSYEGSLSDLRWEIGDESVLALSVSSGRLHATARRAGTTSLRLYDDEGRVSTRQEVRVFDGNPYESVDKEDFYRDYSTAESRQDALYRSECHLMSGELLVPDQEPEVSSNRPSRDGKWIHNSETLYSDGENTYTVVDEQGREAFEIYYGAAYITLEEVAAYVYAFGDVPVNYSDSKSERPYRSPWGEYLRLNNSFFSGDVDDYPYEPVLPEISGCGGDLEYFEIDIGTTGTDCDPKYPSRLYNDGDEITRGAARIVYSRYYASTGEEVAPEDRYVFYTYNHYNDFQEYLNYENGWGEMFGNITGGGVISSKNPALCNPTPYVETIRAPLSSLGPSHFS